MFLTFNKYYFCEKEVSKIKSISKKFLLYFTQFTQFIPFTQFTQQTIIYLNFYLIFFLNHLHS